MSRCLIGLGSNVGDRAQQLEFAVRRLRETPGVEILAQSRWIETKPVGGPSGQPLYLNGAALIETAIEPLVLLGILHQIEDEAGRQRAEHWGPRTLDLDLLLYGDTVLNTSPLIVPHPRLALRRFVLEPAAEVAPMMLHPLLGRTMADLWRRVCQSRHYVAFTGTPARDRAALARAAATAAGATLIEGHGEELERRLAGSPNPPWDVAIEFVARWSELLSVERWLRTEGWLVSDFHWPDLAADLFLNLDARALQGTRPRDLRARITAASRRVMSPRFVVNLTPAVETTASETRGSVESAGIPVLRLSAASQPNAVREIVAAVHALSE